MDVKAGFWSNRFAHDFATGKYFELDVNQLRQEITGGDREFVQCNYHVCQWLHYIEGTVQNCAHI